MSSQDIAQAWSFQILGYTCFGMYFLVVYRMLLNIDEEVELIWKRRYLKKSSLLYGLLAYGGVLSAVIELLSSLIDSGTTQPYNLCLAVTILGDGVFLTTLFGLNAMMALRVYAIYNKSRRVFVFLTVSFMVNQALSVGTSIAMMATMTVVVADGCNYYPETALYWLQAASRFLNCAYEAILFAMLLYHVIDDQRYRNKHTFFNPSTLLEIITRDNILYFFQAFLSFAMSACSYLPDIPLSLQINPLWTVWYGSMTTFTMTMTGPIMILSIMRFDDAEIHGGTCHTTDLDTVLQFARVEAQSQTAPNLALLESQ